MTADLVDIFGNYFKQWRKYKEYDSEDLAKLVDSVVPIVMGLQFQFVGNYLNGRLDLDRLEEYGDYDIRGAIETDVINILTNLGYGAF